MPKISALWMCSNPAGSLYRNPFLDETGAPVSARTGHDATYVDRSVDNWYSSATYNARDAQKISPSNPTLRLTPRRAVSMASWRRDRRIGFSKAGTLVLGVARNKRPRLVNLLNLESTIERRLPETARRSTDNVLLPRYCFFSISANGSRLLLARWRWSSIPLLGCVLRINFLYLRAMSSCVFASVTPRAVLHPDIIYTYIDFYFHLKGMITT